MPDLTNALVAEWKQVPAAMFQHLGESLPRRGEAVPAAKGDKLHINAHDFWNEMFDVQVSTYIWSCSVLLCMYIGYSFGHFKTVFLHWAIYPNVLSTGSSYSIIFNLSFRNTNLTFNINFQWYCT